MGLFGRLFDKKQCAFCGGDIGMLGNRKLEDGNMCKSCAAKLSPWFSERRQSTVAQIGEQLAYRENNQKAVAAFNTTRTLGRDMKILLDENAGKFMVTRARNLQEANPDVLDYSQVTGVDIDIDEDQSESKRTDKDGNKVSFVPPRYNYSYDFKVIIHVNHPYFDEISFRLNPSSIRTTEVAVMESKKPNPILNQDYKEYNAMARDIKRTLTSAREEGRKDARPRTPVTCPICGATTTPDVNGCCEYCGSSLNA